MHELSIMECALEQVLEKAREAGATRIHVIRLRVGALSGVVPEALQFAFAGLAPDTIAEHATLELESVAARFWCEACQQEFEADNLLAECPNCGGLSRSLRSGRELELASMEIE